MADFDDLPQRAFAPRLTRMQSELGQEDPYSTADILGRMPQPTFPDWLRQNAPEGGAPDDSTPWSQFASRIARTGKNIVGGGMNTAANWLDWTPKVGPDTIAPLGLAPMGMALTPRNAVGVFGGPLAKTADHAALAKAQELAGKGVDRDFIWKETGWGLGPDGKWRFEIDDSKSVFTPDTPIERVSQMVDHPALFQAYPDVANLAAKRDKSTDFLGDRALNGYFDSSKNVVSVHDELGRTGGRPVALHELQHVLQEREGFGRGDNPSAIDKDIKAARASIEIADQNIADAKMQLLLAKRDGGDVADISKRIGSLQEWRKGLVERASGDSFDKYRRTAGEVEARNAANRKDMTPEDRRSTPPWKTQDVPDEQQIVRLLSDQSRASVPGAVINSIDQAQASTRAGAGLGHPDSVPGAEKGITAYHGSPHDFEKFDSTKIGTGEGAQAYGHGLYFAEREGVAKEYRDKLTDGSNLLRKDGSTWDPAELEHLNVRVAARNSAGDLDKVLARANALRANPDMSPQMQGMLDRDIAKLTALKDAGGVAPNPGRMYEVRINADPESFLDWDKPLSQQSEAVKGLLNHPKVAPMAADGWADKITGAKAYRYLSGQEPVHGMYTEGAAGTAALRDAGVPGIKYLDQGSRNTVNPPVLVDGKWTTYNGNGVARRFSSKEAADKFWQGAEDAGRTRNYVVFDADKIEILKKYGWVPAGMVGGGMMMTPPDAQATQLPERAFKD